MIEVVIMKFYQQVLLFVKDISIPFKPNLIPITRKKRVLRGVVVERQRGIKKFKLFKTNSVTLKIKIQKLFLMEKHAKRRDIKIRIHNAKFYQPVYDFFMSIPLRQNEGIVSFIVL